MSKHFENEKMIVLIDSDLQELIPGFLENRYQDVLTIREKLQENDYETIQLLGHSMKGFGTGYGFAEISKIGKFIETSAKEKNPKEIARWVDELEYYLQHVEVVFQ